MNDILIRITYLDGSKEEIDCCDFEAKNGVLCIKKRYEQTICYPLTSILKYETYRQ